MFNIDNTELIKTLWTSVIKPLWWFWIVVIIFSIIIPIAEAYIEKWLDKRWLDKHKKLSEWKTMNPKRFERVVAIIFESLGYKARVVGGAGDGGIDIMAYKEGKRFFIQCKRKERIPPSEIRDFAGAIQRLNPETEKGFFVTTGNFSEEGEAFARNNPIKIDLIKGIELEKLAQRGDSGY